MMPYLRPTESRPALFYNLSMVDGQQPWLVNCKIIITDNLIPSCFYQNFPLSIKNITKLQYPKNSIKHLSIISLSKF